MTENINPIFDPQLNALMQVMNEITANRVPLRDPHELAARSTLRDLQFAIDDRNVLDDGELIDTLNQTIIEIKYLLAVISDLKKGVSSRDRDIESLAGRLAHTSSELRRVEWLNANRS